MVHSGGSIRKPLSFHNYCYSCCSTGSIILVVVLSSWATPVLGGATFLLQTSSRIQRSNNRSLQRHHGRRLMSQLQSKAAVAPMTPESVTGAAAAAVAKLRVVSYNVLSSHLSEPSYYTTLAPEYLDATTRVSKLLTKLDQEIATATAQQRSVVFCLQEVSTDWAGALHTFFAQRQFHVIAGLYGKKFNGYMGVLTAYPIHTLDTVAVDIVRVGDTGTWPAPSPPEPPVNRFVRTWLGPPMKYLGSLFGAEPAREPECHWSLAQRRSNVLVTTVVRDKESHQTVAIGNYHMPCCFYAPKVMMLHCDLCLGHVQRVAEKQKDQQHPHQQLQQQSNITSIHHPSTDADAASDLDATTAATASPRTTTTDSAPTTTTTDNIIDSPKQQRTIATPYILAGDFNMKPDSGPYRLCTTGVIDPTDQALCYPTPPAHDPNHTWQPTLLESVRSAYASAANSHYKEPDFTNHARAREDEPFIDTLDYIFVSSHGITVDSVLPLPHRDDVEGPFPNESEPSDHILIAANLDVSAELTTTTQDQ